MKTIKNIWAVLIISVFLFTSISWEAKKKSNPIVSSFSNFSQNLYSNLNIPELNYTVFTYALKGYYAIDKHNSILSIIDMSKSSKSQRFFIIDIKNEKVLFKSIVAHGKNSGLEFAKTFSNQINSHKTSLGFYKTAETYMGKHGLSLRLDGLEFSNNNARKRAIVIHSADYVSNSFIKKNGRLGRSYGCPSLPKENYNKIIESLKKNSVLFIYYPNQGYLKSSKLINKNMNDFKENLIISS